MKDGAWDRFVSYGFLCNADKERYGKLIKSFRDDFANGYDNFPKKIADMRERISLAYKEDKKQVEASKKDKSNNHNSNQGNE